MAFCAARDFPFGKLLSVDVLVAVLALCWRRLEVHVHQLGFEVRWFMAIDASRCAVCPEQRKIRLRVVEAGKLFPRLRRMARLAPCQGTVSPRLLHALLELSFMRIVVATRAIQSLPVINSRRLRLELGGLLMTFGAWNRHMPTGQHKVSFLMLGQAERRRLIRLQIVAAVAGIKVRSRRKLSLMLVGMTVSAALELDLEQSVLALRNMALRAFQSRVLPLQRIRARRVFLHREDRRLPSLDGMARSALPTVFPLGKLPAVRIRLVTVRTLLEYQRLFKVAVGVALCTSHAPMLAFQRKLRLGVIEALVDRLQRHLLPPSCVMARLAGLRETPMMRILVAVGALAERNPHVLRLSVRSVRMTLGALHLQMQPRQRIACLRVIKLRLTGLADVDRLPVHEIVALLANGPQTAFVLVFMAGNATRRECEVGPARVLDLDGRAFLRRNMRRIVAFITGQARVLAFEQISRVIVIECPDVPLDERKVFAVMLRVTTRALLARPGGNIVSSVQALASRKPDCNLPVTVQALQRRLPAELMATGAVGRSVQRLVWLRQRPRRDLR